MRILEKYLIFPCLLFVLTSGLSGCATYYHKNLKFQEAFASGDLERADRLLDKNEKAAEDRNRLLYFMQKGVVLQMMGEYEQSNEILEKAYFFIEDYKKSLGYEALALISNPMVRPYTGEDHEKVLIHYYKALNYLMLQQPDKALVEARRLNNRLNLLNDAYEGRKNRYKDDAFAHIIMGIAYEMQNDWNNAFIAYRNAYNTYKNNYSADFGVPVPEQLKEDLMRTAYLNGFQQDIDFYEREFNLDYRYERPGGGELVFFWHNGLGPVKAEWSINFTVVKGAGGVVTFVNDELGVNFSFPLPRDEEGSGSLGDLKFVRVAFPKYEDRQPVFNSASLRADSTEYKLQKVEDISAIAFATLQDRFFREAGSALLRLATKQASELAARKEHEDLGAVISVLNALTEKADTRNWQTLPNEIYYCRVPLKAGENEVTFTTQNSQGNQVTETFKYDVQRGEKVFQVFSSLASYPPQP